VSKWLDLAADDVAVVGEIPSGLPSVDVPSPGFVQTLQLAPAAVGLFLVAFADEILTARSYAGKHEQHVDVGAELVAMGAANAAAGLTQGFAVGASGSRTAVNDSMGARSQVAGLIAAGVVALVVLFLTGPIADLPKAVLGAAIVSAAVGLVDRASWLGLWTTDRVEVAIAAVTTASVVLAGVLEAIVFAVGLSIVDVVRRSAKPHDAVLGWVESLGRYADVSVHPSARLTPGVVVYRLDDRLFLANARYFKARVREAVRGAPTETVAVVLDAEGVTHVDATGLAALTELEGSLNREGIRLVVARMKARVRQRLVAGGAGDLAGPDRQYGTVRAAVEACARSGSTATAPAG
jgi:sulfate permease, SulP family